MAKDRQRCQLIGLLHSLTWIFELMMITKTSVYWIANLIEYTIQCIFSIYREIYYYILYYKYIIIYILFNSIFLYPSTYIQEKSLCTVYRNNNKSKFLIQDTKFQLTNTVWCLYDVVKSGKRLLCTDVDGVRSLFLNFNVCYLPTFAVKELCEIIHRSRTSTLTHIFSVSLVTEPNNCNFINTKFLRRI